MVNLVVKSLQYDCTCGEFVYEIVSIAVSFKYVRYTFSNEATLIGFFKTKAVQLLIIHMSMIHIRI